MEYQFGITVLIQNHIFRLDVSIDDALTVKKGQGLDNTRCVEPGAAFVQTSPEAVRGSVDSGIEQRTKQMVWSLKIAM